MVDVWPPVIYVYCAGRPGKSHAPSTIRSYQRFTPGEWTMLPGSLPGTSGIYMTASHTAPDRWPTHGSRIRLRCKGCNFDDKRNLDREYGGSYPPFSDVFEKWYAAGQDALSVRELVRLVWPS
jgi:hypothetical protein